MKQNVIKNELKYQEFLILAYFKSHYKRYKFNEIAQMMGMTYSEMRKSIEYLIESNYLICINEYIVIAKKGEEILEEKKMQDFFVNYENKVDNKKRFNIDEPYIPIGFKL